MIRTSISNQKKKPKMKKVATIVLFLLIIGCLSAQESAISSKAGKIGISFASFGTNEVVRFTVLDGDATYKPDFFYALGIHYVYPLRSHLGLEAGIEYVSHRTRVIPNIHPLIFIEPYREKISFVSIPISVRADFLKYFFVQGGMLLNIDGSSDLFVHNQSGLGVLAGLAFQYQFDMGISVFVNPYTKLHSLLPFQKSRYHQRLWESGFRIGISYDLGKL